MFQRGCWLLQCILRSGGSLTKCAVYQFICYLCLPFIYSLTQEKCCSAAELDQFCENGIDVAEDNGVCDELSFPEDPPQGVLSKVLSSLMSIPSTFTCLFNHADTTNESTASVFLTRSLYRRVLLHSLLSHPPCLLFSYAVTAVSSA